ncbi:hypothetical protein [Sphingomonas sp.]|uniref:hypothetical protein n=1 Tax=Sphingomonas sp. TaxID=28214 RepID=UPI00286E4AE2|nr:hypothetical protein [Sphingomonas sp.]
MKMIEGARSWLLAVALVSGCDSGSPVPESNLARNPSVVEQPDVAATARPQAARPPEVDAGRYSSIDPAACKELERNDEEGGYSRHSCGGPAGYALEISESDLRQDVVVIAPGGGRSRLQLSSLVANGAFNSLGKTAEWRGAEDQPSALIVRLNVAAGPEPIRPDISNLVVARLANPACVVAVVPPGPDQNAKARRIADGDLTKCIGR